MMNINSIFNQEFTCFYLTIPCTIKQWSLLISILKAINLFNKINYNVINFAIEFI